MKRLTSNGTANKEQWSGVALPLVRRVFGEIAAKDFVSVQPMNLPSGLVFFLDFKYGDSVLGTNDVASSGVFRKGFDLMGNTSKSAAFDVDGGFYGAGKFGYSLKNDTVSLTPTYASASWKDVGFSSDLSASIANNDITKLTIPIASFVGASTTLGLDTTAVGAIFASGSTLFKGQAVDSVNGNDIEVATLGEYAVVDNTNVTLFVREEDGSIEKTSGALSINFPVATTQDDRSDFEMAGANVDANLETQDVGIPQIDVELRSYCC